MICFPYDSIYFSRQAESSIRVEDKILSIVGLYIPSRDHNIERYIFESKRSNRIIMGDFNILERDHIPHYSNYFEWEYELYDKLKEAGYIDAFRYLHPQKQEYSWVGRTNDGYRYDHCFVSPDLKKSIKSCGYIHETRDIRITDHSAILVELEIKGR